MRQITILLIAALAMPVLADPGRGHGPGRSAPHGRGDGGGDWAGLAILGVITSLIFLTEHERPAYVQQQEALPTYIERQPNPEMPPANPPNTWYYCASSAMYYPYTKACPEGWQAVPARP